MIRSALLLILCLPLFLSAKEITVLSSEGPPHTIDQHDRNGIDLDVVKAVLSRLGYQVRFKFVPLGRAEALVKSGKYDAMVPIFATEDDSRFYISHPIVKYQPTVFSLSEENLTPSNLAEISGHSIITFQGAPGYFGPLFLELAKQSNYFEAPNMQVIPELLAKGRYDYAVLDKYIFYYFYRIENKRLPITIFKEHDLIPVVNASAAFANQELRDKFNRELVKFLLDDGYNQILQRYLGKLEPK